MYAESTRPNAKREVQKERSAKRDDRIGRPRRAQTCELGAKRAMRMCPQSGQIFWLFFSLKSKELNVFEVTYYIRNVIRRIFSLIYKKNCLRSK